jgi:Zn-dependent protease with chaperone function
MIIRSDTGKVIIRPRSKFRLFDIQTIETVLLLEIVVWSMIKVYNNLMIMNSKVDKNLTSKLSNVVGSLWVVNIMNDVEIVNAFCTREANNIFITRAMIERLQLTENEIIAFLLHEVGHGHERFQKIIRDIPRVSSTYASFRLLEFIAERTVAFALPQFQNLVTFMFSVITMLPPSRYYEYRADKFATDHGYGRHLKSAFKKLISYSERKGNYTINPKKSKIAKLIVMLQELFKTHPNNI